MDLQNGKRFVEKHGPDAKPDSVIKNEILKRTHKNEVPCAVAFEIAKELRVSADAVGMTVDLINYRLVKCQLGLFGYQPKKKIVKPQHTVTEDLKDAISEALVQGRLSCKSAWDIASRLEVHKMKVSGACEAMGVKIKPCQLGAF
ncbi:MAG: hypothetical protein BA867_07180 [Desulfobacterales bacterium S5133MH16]|jgi:hypothetical protein|nr:MAG: hypothetical protein BA867_07180 [Desulfobacterales bacterium S5133MH16]